MAYLFLTCKKATELIEKKKLFGLNRTEKLQLAFHMMMCSVCPQYEHQSELIDDVLEHREPDPRQIKPLDTQIKEQIKKKIGEA